jgi:DNA polymerase-3 subunit gamma/tau
LLWKIGRQAERIIKTFRMSYQVLARKYRPHRFSEVIGQDHVTRTLKNAIEKQRIAHGYIFSGHRGIGKTTIARILAMALNCRAGGVPTVEPCGVCDSCTEIRAGGSVDVIEIDAATNRGIDEIRELREAARYRPARDRYKIYILDEAHQITDAAFNALLKTLEEPPPHIVFIMATTQPEDIPQTIRSRCQHFNFHAVKFDEIVRQLGDIARREHIKADDDALAVLAEAGDGSVRDALSIMDQAIAGSGSELSGEQVRGLLGSFSPAVLEDLLGTVARGATDEALRLLDEVLTAGHNPAHLARQLVRLLRNILVAKVAGENSPLLQVSADERARAGRIAAQFSEEDLARFLQIMLRTYDDLGYRQEQRFHLELGVLKLVHAQRLLPLEQLLSQTGAGALSPVGAALPPGAKQEHPRSGSGSVKPAPEGKASPLAADRARKGSSFGPEMTETSRMQLQTRTAAAVAEVEPDRGDDPAAILGRVLDALEEAGHKMLASTLEGGRVELAGGDLNISISQPATLISVMLTPEARQIANTTATGAAGRPIKVIVSGGVPGTGQTNGSPAANVVRNGAGARSRAAGDTVVQRMMEKFGAEIRTVIDHHKKD